MGSEEWGKLIKKLGDPLSWLGISKRKRISNINAFKARLLLPRYFLIWLLSLFVNFTRIQLANRSQNPNPHTNLSFDLGSFIYIIVEWQLSSSSTFQMPIISISLQNLFWQAHYIGFFNKYDSNLKTQRACSFLYTIYYSVNDVMGN